jgi:hypothetical protein
VVARFDSLYAAVSGVHVREWSMRRYRHHWRFASALVVASVLATALVAVASPNSKEAAAQQYQYEKKVTICHHTGSKSNPTVTIVVSRNAVPAHLAHGDTLVPCPD